MYQYRYSYDLIVSMTRLRPWHGELTMNSVDRSAVVRVNLSGTSKTKAFPEKSWYFYVMMTETPHSPCVNVCKLDAHTSICTGCGRTLAEIGEWSGATAERKCDIRAQLPERMAGLAAGLRLVL